MAVDIHSKGPYPASALSNFAANRFVYEGVMCGSMEGLLQSLKFPRIVDQVEVCALSGAKAKKAGRAAPDWRADQMLYWGGRPMHRHGEEYQAFLDRAFTARAGNERFARALRATGDQPLIHSTGSTDPTSTVLTADELCGRLERARAALLDALPSTQHMESHRVVKASKWLSRHLRHQPDRIGIKLDAAGWVDVDVLLEACSKSKFVLSRLELDEVIARNDKQRFELRAIGGVERIRAMQGHSVDVQLDHEVAIPPQVLYHGTVGRSLDGIFAEGLQRQGRHHVHLSPDIATAQRVGARRGKPVVLAVDAAAMAADGQASSSPPTASGWSTTSHRGTSPWWPRAAACQSP